MAEELTGLDQEIDTPDESLAVAADSLDDTDSELAKQLNVDQLPDDPQELKKLALKRARELRNMGRKSGEDTKTEIKALRAQLETLMQVMGPRPQAAPQGPPPGASDEEILGYYMDRHIEQRYGSKFSAIDRLAELQANAMVEQARQKYGADFDTYQDDIADALTRFPGMTLDEAFRYAASASAEDRATRKVQAGIEAKRGASTVSSPGTPSSGLREPSLEETNTHDYFEWAKKEAINELRRKGMLVPEV